MQVNDRGEQHRELLKCVQNHSPKVIIVDEIGSKAEAEVLRGIAHRGVAIVAIVHGQSLADVLENPSLEGLMGDKSTVTLGDITASQRTHLADQLMRKTRRERVGPPVFSMCIEVRSHTEARVHMDLKRSIDDHLEQLSASDAYSTTKDEWVAAVNVTAN